ncbi:IS1182 family transposase [Streptomyces albicerus]|uniref:IS1182 family transposase n=1 Tax=Streptomyces albicerus TaxID=2569859 RepID=UPI001CEC9782|nr:IS1182 family transposase [Streptomyces albicerus]
MAMGVSSGRAIPALTVRVARASNPRGTAAMWVRDRLDELFTDDDFADWYPTNGRRGLSPARLAMVSVLQYAENLTDRQAAEAVRCRLDWKYCLSMELDDPGFDHSVLSEFRDRMAQGDRADRLLAVVVDRLVAAGLVGRRGRVRTDSTHVLAAVRTLNRVELVGETMRRALEELSEAGEEWLAPLVTAGWARRYGRPVRYERLPRGPEDRLEYALDVGADGVRLLSAVYGDDAPHRLRELSGVQVLRQVWLQQYWFDEEGQLRWREPKSTQDRRSRRETPRRSAVAEAQGRPDPAVARVPWASAEIITPHDAEARFSRKVVSSGARSWIGYRDHQTETCDGTGPNVIIQVVTAPAPEQDIDALPRIHQGLTVRGFRPVEHLVDGGYISPSTIHQALTGYGIRLTGPIRTVSSNREHPGFDKRDFRPDWEQHTLTCPRGETSFPWNETSLDGRLQYSVRFPTAVCRACADRALCTGNTVNRGRHVMLLPRPLEEIQNQARQEQETSAWRERYAMRAGCEATVSETVHAHGLRDCRYRGIAKTHVQHVLTAAGTNIIRLSGCFPPGEAPPQPPRPTSPFQLLCRKLMFSTSR